MERNNIIEPGQSSEHVIIPIKADEQFKFAEIELTNLTKKSFLRDGEHYPCV